MSTLFKDVGWYNIDDALSQFSKPDEKFEILCLPGQDSPYNHEMKNNVSGSYRHYMRNLNKEINLLTVSPQSETDLNGCKKALILALNLNASSVIISSNTVSEFTPLFEELKENGVYIGIITDPNTDSNDLADNAVGFSQENVHAQTIEKLLQRPNLDSKKLRIAYFPGPKSNNFTLKRISGFYDLLKKFKISEEQVCIYPGGNFSPNETHDLAEKVVAENKLDENFVAIFQNDGMLLGFKTYLSENGILQNFPMIGVDGIDEVKKKISENEKIATSNVNVQKNC
ncbi:sugar ABC transporter substrate-binding protein [Candidatus Nitrosarchaeum limnium]|uniref:Periplasmic binding protein domain-containing protein n=1 Tax=Candidatus Nitrosarchaeum limnium BG20 TaxID=859192 RepID=S2EPT7_9ARCH|nr:substrate-binding domain-containing protein [Candidatus Nitrosarchaeum limnium]EPA04494.1 hypothetical protein BG20_I1552 [Candidatus Nitrosarchaeum limnium BG20]